MWSGSCSSSNFSLPLALHSSPSTRRASVPGTCRWLSRLRTRSSAFLPPRMPFSHHHAHPRSSDLRLKLIPLALHLSPLLWNMALFYAPSENSGLLFSQHLSPWSSQSYFCGRLHNIWYLWQTTDSIKAWERHCTCPALNMLLLNGWEVDVTMSIIYFLRYHFTFLQPACIYHVIGNEKSP